MFRKVYNSSSGKVADGPKFSVYIYRHPLESGQEKWHVHFVRKSDGIDAKISIWNFSLMRPTEFDRKTVKVLIEWSFEHRHFLRRKWVQHVLRPFRTSMGKGSNE